MKKEKQYAEVSVSLGSTLNMGDFESLRIHVGITYPCEPKDIDKTFEIVSKRVENMLKKKIKELTGRRVD